MFESYSIEKELTPIWKKDNWSSINRIISLMNIITQACEMNKVKLEFTKSDFLPVLIKVHKMNDRQLETNLHELSSG